VFTGKTFVREEKKAAQEKTVSQCIVIKTFNPPALFGLFRQTALFLQPVVSDLPPEKHWMLELLHISNEVRNPQVAGVGLLRAQTSLPLATVRDHEMHAHRHHWPPGHPS